MSQPFLSAVWDAFSPEEWQDGDFRDFYWMWQGR